MSYWEREEVYESFSKRLPSKYITNELDELIKNNVKSCLDIGCGGGRYSVYLKEKGIDVVSVDNSKSMIKICKQKCLNTILSDFTKIDIYKRQFDLILSVGVFHNSKTINEFKSALEECNRLVKIGGYLLISVFNNRIIDNDLKRVGENVYNIINRDPMILLSNKQLLNLFKCYSFMLVKKVDEHETDVGSGKRCVVTFLLKKVCNTKTFINDYNTKCDSKIDMTMSGKFIANRNITIDLQHHSELLDTYDYEIVEILKDKIRKKYKSNLEIIINSGANGILQNLLKIFFANKGELITTHFSFEQPQYAVKALGGTIKLIAHNCDFSINFNEIYNSVTSKTKAIYLCNPNNPTGILENNKDIIDLASKVNVPVIVDEAAMEFADDKSLMYIKNLPSNIIVVHSFSKAYGFAGLRVGYAGMSKQYINNYYKKITSHANSHLSLYILNEHFEDDSVIENVRQIKNERDILYQGLNELGIEMIKSDSNTLMSKQSYDKMFFDTLEENEIGVVKIPDNYSKCYFRIAVQTKETNHKFLQKIKYLKEQNNGLFTCN